jgi:hypothetical protein
METFLGLIIGMGLSAACGFRVFVPLLGLSLATMTGHLTLSSGFEWIGSWPAFVAFGTATIFEIGAYYIPLLDHLMDTLTTPAAVVAGTIMTASLVTDLSPFLKWTLALIAGGGVAGLVQTGSVLLRGASTAATGGVGNVLVSTGEIFGSILTTLLALIFPILGLLVVVLLCGLIAARWIRVKHKHP